MIGVQGGMSLAKLGAPVADPVLRVHLVGLWMFSLVREETSEDVQVLAKRSIDKVRMDFKENGE